MDNKLCGFDQRVENEMRLKEEKLHQEFEGYIEEIKAHPEMFSEPRLEYLRDFIM